MEDIRTYQLAHELPEELGIAEEDEEVTSFGGLITQEFGKIPEAYETLQLKNIEVTIFGSR